MSSSRIAPLWRSSGRCLAFRPRAMTTATTAPRPRAVASAAAASPAALGQAAARRQNAPVFAAAVRCYADDASIRNGDEISSSSNSSSSNTTQGTEASAAPTELLAQDAAADAAADATDAARQIQGDQDFAPAGTPRRFASHELLRMASGEVPFDRNEVGHKFGLTTAITQASVQELQALGELTSGDLARGDALPRFGRLQERYDPVIAQLTRLLMRDGKLAKAQRDMAAVLNYLRTAPPPKFDPAHPLLPGHPPAAQLPLDPVAYMVLAIDSVAPIIRIMNLQGAAGGGRALPIPLPIKARQRRRQAFVWLLDVVNKKPSRGSGRSQFPNRVAEEIIAIVEGRSSLWEKRLQVHKMGTASRINVAALTRKKRRS